MSGWEDLALCAQTDPEAFYPEKGQSPKPALRVCRRCPVTAECLTDTLAYEVRQGGDPHGVAGGKTAKERKLLLRSMRADRAVEVGEAA